ncbi:MAG: tetratricopeptide repeat protein [Acidobacteriota bacterium]
MKKAAGRPSPTARKEKGRSVVSPPPAATVKPPRLLKETKITTAALSSLEKGIKLIHQREFKKARLELESLVEKYPSEPEIRARARSYLRICRREDPGRTRAAPSDDQLYSLGVLEHNRGNYDAAMEHFRQSLESRPRADYVLYSLAASQTMRGQHMEAIASLKRAIELSEDNRIYAKNDPDFASLHTNLEFMELVGLDLVPPGGPSY